MKTAEDFQRSAKEHNITRWNMHDCSICGYWCGYDIVGDEVFYDSGCDCVRYPSEPRPTSFEDIAEHYNMQTHPQVISEMNKFWHFEEVANQ